MDIKILASKKIVVILSYLLFILYGIPQDIQNLIIWLIVSLIVGVVYLYNNKTVKYKKRIETVAISTLIILLMFYLFFIRWTNSNIINSILDSIGINRYFVVILFDVLFSIFAYNFIYHFITILSSKIISVDTKYILNQNVNSNKIVIIICILCSIIVITLCSKSSFIYPLNDWVDANCYFTVGKSILNGKVVYKDLFEQKGPYLYFIHSLASLLSNQNFIGIYFIELISCYFFLYYSYKTVRLYLNSKSILLVPIIALLTYSSGAFCHGDSAEEIILPILSYIVYLSIFKIKNDSYFTNRESIIIGIIAGLVFWIKYTLVGCFVGMIIIPSILELKRKKYKNIICSFILIIFGVMIVTTPLLIYFVVNNATKDLFDVYFVGNLINYSSDIGNTFFEKLVYGMKKGYVNIRTFNELNGILIIFGLFWIIFTKKIDEFIHIFLMIIFNFIFIYAGGKGLAYYSLALCPLIIWGLLFPFQLIENKLSINYFTILLSISITILVSIFFTSNRYLMFEKKDNMPQYKFAKIINSYVNPTLLNYGFLDGGFYTTTGIVPNCKAFCITNYPSKEYINLQDYYCVNGLCDFIVSRDNEIDYELYELVSTASFYYERETHNYYLYKLKLLNY